MGRPDVFEDYLDEETSGVIVAAVPDAAPEVLTWCVYGQSLELERGADGKWRPLDEVRNLVLVWELAPGWFRAAVSDGALVRLSVPYPDPHSALDACADWFRRMYVAGFLG